MKFYGKTIPKSLLEFYKIKISDISSSVFLFLKKKKAFYTMLWVTPLQFMLFFDQVYLT